jgi:hypothetical protein
MGRKALFEKYKDNFMVTQIKAKGKVECTGCDEYRPGTECENCEGPRIEPLEGLIEKLVARLEAVEHENRVLRGKLAAEIHRRDLYLLIESDARGRR